MYIYFSNVLLPYIYYCHNYIYGSNINAKRERERERERERKRQRKEDVFSPTTPSFAEKDDFILCKFYIVKIVRICIDYIY